MTGSRTRPGVCIVAGLLLGLLVLTLPGVQGDEVPSEDQCRPYIEKALKDLGTEGSEEHTSGEATDGEGPSQEANAGDVNESDEKSGSREKRDASGETAEGETEEDKGSDNEVDQERVETVEVTTDEAVDQEEAADTTGESQERNDEAATAQESQEKQQEGESVEEKTDETVERESGEKKDDEASAQDETEPEVEEASGAEESGEKKSEAGDEEEKSKEEQKSGEEAASEEQPGESTEKTAEEEEAKPESKEEETDSKQKESKEEEATSKQEESKEDDKKSVEEEAISKEAAPASTEASQEAKSDEKDGNSKEGDAEKSSESGQKEGEEEESSPEEEELIMEIEIPEILRPRDHIGQLLKLDEENEEKEKAIEKAADIILRDLKRLYDTAIKPLETLYKYRDLSNRHFGDPEIFSKPLVLFMGPWSGGKSSIINYLMDIEYKPTSLRTGAEPSPAYFNILMHGEEEEILDGTQLAADWTFSGLQKFGQGLLDRLKGYKLKNKLLEKVNIVEIPGILEIRKQVQRLFPFNDACQWFIDRADIIFLVYDPSKLDVGPETEAILDQLKGREYQTRIILNKADQVKPEELMRVQGALIWNISPLMSSAEPPIMYSASLWSIPFESGAPTRLLYAQERAFLRDLRSAVDKRVEHKIASARRFAVRVRNHAKMVDCYLTTYYNHKSFFAKRKDVSDRIVENPQDYHIYEGLSTLTNISRYDLPDPDVYRDFFRLNPLYDFPLLSSTCTYFRGCPINRLDIAIAYDLPELIGKYKKSVEAVMHEEAAATTAPAPVAQTPPKETPKPTTGAKSSASRLSFS